MFSNLFYFLLEAQQNLMEEVGFLPENMFPSDKFSGVPHAVAHLHFHSPPDDGESAADESSFSYPNCLFPSWKDTRCVSSRWHNTGKLWLGIQNIAPQPGSAIICVREWPCQSLNVIGVSLPCFKMSALKCPLMSSQRY